MWRRPQGEHVARSAVGQRPEVFEQEDELTGKARTQVALLMRDTTVRHLAQVLERPCREHAVEIGLNRADPERIW
ncbi:MULTISPECIES: hypothetical protein [Paraburkholderia]|uniref:Uncharacterized protein n=1 Tax=Paraburkholderia metrosideri TaxID=580937 RepID=A0ABW9E5Q1_9BURK